MMFNLARNAAVTTAALFAALSFSGVAQAITDTVFRYTTEKTGHFTIDNMAMIPDNSTSATAYLNNWENGLTPTAHVCFNAGANLPNGATITALTVYFKSGMASERAVWPLTSTCRSTGRN